MLQVKRQLEEDADREIEDLKDKYEQRLQGERDAALRLKGENGIMRKKFQGLQKDIDEQKEQLGVQHEQQKDLYTTIKGGWPEELCMCTWCKVFGVWHSHCNQQPAQASCIAMYEGQVGFGLVTA